MELTYETLSLLFLIAGIAGTIDSMAGGGGLLTVPALLASGVPPVQALATNKLQGAFASFSSSLYFFRKGMVNIRSMGIAIGFTFLGAAVASQVLQYINSEKLNVLIPLLLVAVAVYFWLSPPLENQQGKARLSEGLFGFLIGTSVGFYDGFFGPGAGSLYMLAYVSLRGMTLLNATAHTKVLNFVSNITALGFFIHAELVIWKIGLVMAVGSFIGAQIGAKLVHTKGQHLIRPMVIIMTMLMALKLSVEQFALSDLLSF